MSGWEAGPRWARPMRLHSPDASFYLQSALEAAQLLMCAAVEAVGNELRVAAIRDLGWPISLIDLALGWLASNDEQLPLYVCGFEAGYDLGGYPALYDPRMSGDRSPLFNSLEAPQAVVSRHCADVDRFPIEALKDAPTLGLIRELSASAADEADPALLRTQVQDCGWAVLASSVAALPLANLSRHLELVQRVPHHDFTPNDRAVVDIIFWESHRRLQQESVTPVARQMVSAIEASQAAVPARQPGAADTAAPVVDLTVLIPTRNNSASIPALIDRLSAICRSDTVEILFIDDSVDDTPDVIAARAAAAALPVRQVRRPKADRSGGRSGAVAAGAKLALGRYLVVLDADLRHPPELIPILRELVEDSDVHVAVASRYHGGGGPLSLDSAWRQWTSNKATLAARAMFPRRVGRKCSDPMTGFFCLDRRAVDLDRLGLQGACTLLQILLERDLTVREVPFVVEERPAAAYGTAWLRRAVLARELLRLRYHRA